MQDANQDSWCFIRDSNRVPLEQKAAVLQREPKDVGKHQWPKNKTEMPFFL